MLEKNRHSWRLAMHADKICHFRHWLKKYQRDGGFFKCWFNISSDCSDLYFSRKTSLTLHGFSISLHQTFNSSGIHILQEFIKTLFSILCLSKERWRNIPTYMLGTFVCREGCNFFFNCATIIFVLIYKEYSSHSPIKDRYSCPWFMYSLIEWNKIFLLYHYRPHPKDGGRYCFQFACQSLQVMGGPLVPPSSPDGGGGGRGEPIPPRRNSRGVLNRRWALCLLRSRRRIFLFYKLKLLWEGKYFFSDTWYDCSKNDLWKY